MKHYTSKNAQNMSQEAQWKNKVSMEQKSFQDLQNVNKAITKQDKSILYFCDEKLCFNASMQSKMSSPALYSLQQ